MNKLNGLAGLVLASTMAYSVAAAPDQISTKTNGLPVMRIPDKYMNLTETNKTNSVRFYPDTDGLKLMSLALKKDNNARTMWDDYRKFMNSGGFEWDCQGVWFMSDSNNLSTNMLNKYTLEINDWSKRIKAYLKDKK